MNQRSFIDFHESCRPDLTLDCFYKNIASFSWTTLEKSVKIKWPEIQILSMLNEC